MIAAHHPASIDTWPPLLVTTCQLTDHTGTPRHTTFALTMCMRPRTVSVNTHYLASASMTTNDAHATSYSVRRHSRPLRHLQPTRAHRPMSANIRNITASNGHHFWSPPAPANASQCNRNCSMPIVPDMCSRTTHSAPMHSCNTKHAYVLIKNRSGNGLCNIIRSSSDIPFENPVIEGEYILLHFIHYLHTFWSEGECCNTYFSLSRHNKYIIIIHSYIYSSSTICIYLYLTMT